MGPWVLINARWYYSAIDSLARNHTLIEASFIMAG